MHFRCCRLTFFRKSFPGSVQFRQLNRFFNQWEHFKLRSRLHQIGCGGKRWLSRPQESKPWTGWLQQHGSSTICLAFSRIFPRAFDPIECNVVDTSIKGNRMYDISQWQPIIEHQSYWNCSFVTGQYLYENDARWLVATNDIKTAEVARQTNWFFTTANCSKFIGALCYLWMFMIAENLYKNLTCALI